MLVLTARFPASSFEPMQTSTPNRQFYNDVQGSVNFSRAWQAAASIMTPAELHIVNLQWHIYTVNHVFSTPKHSTARHLKTTPEFRLAPCWPHYATCTKLVSMDLGTSLSAPDVSSLDKNEVIGAILSSCNRPSASMVSLNALKSRFLHLNRRVRSLEAINSSLKVENAAVRAEIALLGDELQTSRVSLYAEVEHRRKDALYIHQVDERINDLVYQIRRYGDFIHILAGIGMNSPIYRAALSIMSNVEAEDALVASIVEAAKDKQSPWSQIVPAVVGPRSPEQYVSAINLTLRTRQDLRERERVCEFWKTTAKLEPNNANLLTPSSSTLTDNNCSCNPDVPAKAKSTVLDEMLKDLKNNDFSESSPSPVSSLTFKSMAEWAENAAKEVCHIFVQRGTLVHIFRIGMFWGMFSFRYP